MVLPLLWAAGAGVIAPAPAARGAGPSPFATRVMAYDPAPGQFVLDAAFNDPARALGAPMGGGTDGPDQSKLATLGGLGGSITLGFDAPVVNLPASPFNPHGLDLIVFGNAFYAGGADRRFAEPAVIEVSRDDNGNGLADDAWYVIPGSHLPAAGSGTLTRTVATWDDAPADATHPPSNPAWVPSHRSGVWTTAAFALDDALFGAVVLVNPLGPASAAEGVWGYADCSPTMVLGDLDGDGVPDDPELDAATFYTRPDDPFAVGVSPGSAGGDAIDLSWAIDPATGAGPERALEHVDFVRLSTAVRRTSTIFGEASAEIGGVARVRPRDAGDFNADGAVNDDDLGEFVTAYFESLPGPGGFALAAGCPGAEPPFDVSGHRADATTDCALNDDDLALYITIYFAR